MKKLAVILNLFILVAVNSSSYAQFQSKYGTEKDFKRLVYLNTLYIQSWIRSDTGLFNRLLWANDFIHQSGANGYLYPRNEIARIFGAKRFNQISWFYTEDTRIQFINDSVAMVFSRTRYIGESDSVESQSQYNDVYVKRKGSWICVSANITDITEIDSRPPILTKIPDPLKLEFAAADSINMQSVLQSHKKLRTALQTQNYRYSQKFLANDFMMLNSNGSLETKSLLLKTFKKTKHNTSNFYQMMNVFVRFVTADVAMVHGAVIVESKGGIKTGIQFNDILAFRNGQWVPVCSNNTPIRN